MAQQQDAPSWGPRGTLSLARLRVTKIGTATRNNASRKCTEDLQRAPIAADRVSPPGSARNFVIGMSARRRRRHKIQPHFGMEPPEGEDERRSPANSPNGHEADPTLPVGRVAMPKGIDLGAQNNRAAIPSIETPGHVLRTLELRG